MSTVATKQFPDKLIAAIQGIFPVGEGKTYNETSKRVYISVSDVDEAETIRSALLETSWHFDAEDAGGPRTASQAFDADFAPFTFDISKPEVEDDTVLLLHMSALIRTLEDCAPRVVRVGQKTKSFQLQSTIVCSWFEAVEFVPVPFDAEPRRLVRDLTGSDLVPSSLSIWLLRSIETAPHDDKVFQLWKSHATSVYFRVLCTEIEPDRSLLFRGQPVLRIVNSEAVAEIANERFDELHSLVAWIYENKREAETRHGLVVAELVRASMNAKTAADLMKGGFRGVLESARNAYQLGLHKLSNDALKALAELRKSVGDETSKVADFVRQMATSVAGALFAAVGVLAARLTLAKDSDAFSVVAVIVAAIMFLYVMATAKSGWYFLAIQRSLRHKWKERTRKFLSIEEYADLVEVPAKQAERAYDWTAWLSILAAFVAMVSVVWFSYPDAVMASLDSLEAFAKSAWQLLPRASTSDHTPAP